MPSARCFRICCTTAFPENQSEVHRNCATTMITKLNVLFDVIRKTRSPLQAPFSRISIERGFVLFRRVRRPQSIFEDP